MGKLDLLGIGALVNAGSDIFKGVLSGIEAARGQKGFNRAMANRPTYEIPKEYQDILAQYQQAQAGNMPGYDQQLSQIGQLGARTRGAAERGAISSTAYGAQVGDIYQKELDAIQNLGAKQEEYKSSMLDKVAQAQGNLGQQKSEQWNLNQFLPWQTEMNRYGEMAKTGKEGVFGAIQGLGNTASDYFGTKYFANMMQGLQNGGGNNTGKSPYGFQSKPVDAFNSQQNLEDTLKNNTSQIKINW